MAHFSPVNGAYPHKDQVDRSCLVADGNEAIQRGTIIFVNESGEFEIAKDASKQPLYFALQPYGDMQAAMAGSRGYTGGGKGKEVLKYKNVTGSHVGAAAHALAAGGQPKITGLSFQEHGNYQTDMYDHEGTYKIGDPLTVKDGVFVPGTEENAVARVYAEPDDYYFNGAVLDEGWSTGAWIQVLRVSL